MSASLRALWRAPAVQAATLQIIAFLIMLAMLQLSLRWQLPVSAVLCAAFEGVIALALTMWCRLAWWWRPIQLMFPVALVLALSLRLPPGAFLAAFVFLLGLYWSTFRTQVPFYPSGARVREALATLMPAGRALRLIDIGSGLGGLALDLARRRPDCAVSGIELAPLPWLVSSLRARLSGSSANFIRGDYHALAFGDYDIVFAYLSPAAMSALWRQARVEMRPGSMLVSYEFIITEKAPDLTIIPVGRGPSLYVWNF